MISKSRFLNLLRCPRYCALDDIKKYKTDALVTIDEIKEIVSKEKIGEILSSMMEEFGEDLADKKDEQMEVMLPYFNQVEIVAGDAIKEQFGGNVIYSLNTYEQKHYECAVGEYDFHCFVDGYQEDKDVFNIFEVKATTTKKFLDLGPKVDGEKVSIFKKGINGIYKLIEEYYESDDSIDEMPLKKYYQNRLKLSDRYSATGKYIYDLAFQRFVIEQGLKKESKLEQIKSAKYFLVVLNSEYIHDGKEYKKDAVSFIDLTKITNEMQVLIKNDIDTVIKYLEYYDVSKYPIGKQCLRKDRRECKYSPICFENVNIKNSILTYIGNHNGFKDDDGEKHLVYDLINEGKNHMNDIPKTWLNRKNNQVQREVIENSNPYVDKNKIQKAIDSLTYPIYHLDFESFPCPLPRFEGEKAYMQSLFQYSIHIEREPGICDKEKDHYEFLSKDNLIDDRLELVQGMLGVIDVNNPGTVVVYNESFEKTRIKELAVFFPKYKEDLYKLNEMVFDLMYVLKGNKKMFERLGVIDNEGGMNYYHEDLQGSFSIKKVLPIFSDLTYEGMGVANGNEAMITYAMFNEWAKYEADKYKIKYNELVEYCKQDTWAMFEILDKLRKV